MNKKIYARYCNDLATCLKPSIDDMNSILEFISWDIEIAALPFKNFKDEYFELSEKFKNDKNQQKQFLKRVLKFRRLSNIYTINELNNETILEAKGINVLKDDEIIPNCVKGKKYKVLLHGTILGRNVAGDGWILKPSKIIKSFEKKTGVWNC